MRRENERGGKWEKKRKVGKEERRKKRKERILDECLDESLPGRSKR